MMAKNRRRSLPALSVSGFAGIAALLVSPAAHADRVYVVQEYRDPPEYDVGRSSLDLAFDGEGAVPLMDRRFQSGNDLTAAPKAIARKIGAPQAVVAQDIVNAGNTSSASIPLALSRMIERGEIASGSKALLLGFGAGMCYAAQVITVP